MWVRTVDDSQIAVGGSQSRLLLLTLWVCLGHKLSTEVVSSVKGREGQPSFSCSCPHIITAITSPDKIYQHIQIL